VNDDRPVIIDAFCCAGGASMGYHRAGFRVIGVDRDAQPDYPFEFVQGDAIELLPELVRFYNAKRVAGSPPCQAASVLTTNSNAHRGFVYPQLIPAFREACEATGLPYVIENVAGAPIRKDLMLCGEMFGLGVIRHRYFELGSGAKVSQPPHPQHRGRVAGYRNGEWITGPYFQVYGDGGGKGTIKQWQDAMGMPWVGDRKHLAEAIPPAYTAHVGADLIRGLED
jgi:hypothetical protein